MVVNDAPFGQVERRTKHVEGSLFVIGVKCKGYTVMKMSWKLVKW